MKKSADQGNVGALYQYFQCKEKVNPNNNNHLDDLLEYEKFNMNRDDKKSQSIFLDIALQYIRNCKIEEALKYFLKGIEFNPEADLSVIIFIFFL